MATDLAVAAVMKILFTLLPLLALPTVALGQWNQTLELFTPDGGIGEEFGTAVAVGPNRAWIGANLHVHGTERRGAVFLYEVPSGKLLAEIADPAGGVFDRFGWDLATHSGVTIVGAPLDDDLGADSGSVFLFDAQTGVLLRKLHASDAAPGHLFGYSVAIRGQRAVIGAPGHPVGGAAYVFDVITGQELLRLQTFDGAVGDRFGRSVAIDGERVLVGAYLDDDVADASGSAYLFDANTGQRLHKFSLLKGQANDTFGRSVALGGGLAAIGVPGNGPGPASGAVIIYDAVTGQKLRKITTTTGGFSAYFGVDVALQGQRLVVGSPADGAPSPNNGATYVFDVRSGEELVKLKVADGLGADSFGHSVAIHGQFLLAGSRRGDGQVQDTGTAHMFVNCLADRFCSPAAVNSEGVSGTIQVDQCSLSRSVWVRACNLPPGELGMLLVGHGEDALQPPGSEGRLCLSGHPRGIGRYVADMGPSTFFGCLDTDLVFGATGGGNAALPNALGGTLLPGRTWNFQYWYRDGARFNFTDAISVTFVE